jgi:hypothetical protein
MMGNKINILVINNLQKTTYYYTYRYTYTYLHFTLSFQLSAMVDNVRRRLTLTKILPHDNFHLRRFPSTKILYRTISGREGFSEGNISGEKVLVQFSGSNSTKYAA